MILEEDAEKQSSYDSSHNETSSDTSKDHTSVESKDQDDVESRKWGGVDEKPNLSFDNASIRAAFVQKVFGIVTIMIIINILMTAPVLFVEELRQFLIEHGWIQSVALLAFLVVYFGIISCSPLVRRVPCNIVMLMVFTFAAGAMLTAICASVPPYTVALALATTAATCFAVVIFASQTLYDITSYTFVLLTMTVAVSTFGMALAIASMFFHIKALHVVFSAIACIIFIIHLTVDIQMIMGGRRYELSPEEYVFAALMLFGDIYEIFVNILNLLNTAD